MKSFTSLFVFRYQRMIKKFLSIFFPKSKEPDPMKYLIVGLGNAGAEYDDTRHNVGFEVVDHLASQFEVTFKDARLGFITSFKHKGRTFNLVKPTTYMNRSGKAVNYWMKELNLKPENLLVVLDDLNIDFGKVRLKGKGKDGGHNGLKDIDQVLGSQNYSRLRVGIGNKFEKGRQVDYVLGKWSSDERKSLPEIIKHCADGVLSYGTIGLARSMNNVNR